MRRPTALLVLCLAGVVLVWLVARPLAAAGSRGDVGGTLRHGGLDRAYLLHLPSANVRGEKAPLLVALHGGGGDGRQFARFTRLNELADAEGFAVVYPDGAGRHWADGRGTTAPDRQGVDDAGFLAALADRLTADYALDPARVYAAGISNGGFMVQRLACERADRFAAVVAISATGAARQMAACASARPIPVALMLGTEDPLVPWGGGPMPTPPGAAGGDTLSGPATFARWAELDDCAGDPDRADEPDRAGDGTRIVRLHHTRCAGGAEVLLYQIEGGDHTWPNAVQYLPVAIVGRVTHNLDANAALWTFVSRHRLD